MLNELQNTYYSCRYRLDLKNNPLEANLAKAAGPCITPADCQTCAKRVVSLMQSIQSHQERERQKLLLEERKKIEIQRQAEEMERERIKAEKKAAKDRRRQEAREREEMARKKAELEALNSMRHEMERNTRQQANHSYEESKPGSSCLWSILMFIMAVSLLGIAFGGSLIWIYTGGHMDQRSIERALPVIQKDFDATLIQVTKKTDEWLTNAKPYTAKATETAHWLWEEFKRRNDIVAHKINMSLGPYFCSAKTSFLQYWKWASVEAAKLWKQAVPYFNDVLEQIRFYNNTILKWMETNLPIYVDIVYKKCMEFYGYVQTSMK